MACQTMSSADPVDGAVAEVRDEPQHDMPDQQACLLGHDHLPADRVADRDTPDQQACLRIRQHPFHARVVQTHLTQKSGTKTRLLLPRKKLAS